MRHGAIDKSDDLVNEDPLKGSIPTLIPTGRVTTSQTHSTTAVLTKVTRQGTHFEIVPIDSVVLRKLGAASMRRSSEDIVYVRVSNLGKDVRWYKPHSRRFTDLSNPRDGNNGDPCCIEHNPESGLRALQKLISAVTEDFSDLYEHVIRRFVNFTRIVRSDLL